MSLRDLEKRMRAQDLADATSYYTGSEPLFAEKAQITLNIAVCGGCLAGIAAICALIVYWYPVAPIGYGVAAVLGLAAGWIVFQFLFTQTVQQILGFIVTFRK